MNEYQMDRQRHVNYLLGASFENLMNDMYIGLGTHLYPPYFEDVVTDLLEGRVAVQEENQDFFINGATEDPMLLMVQQLTDEDIKRVERDVIQYVHQNRLHMRYAKGSGKPRFLYCPTVMLW